MNRVCSLLLAEKREVIDLLFMTQGSLYLSICPRFPPCQGKDNAVPGTAVAASEETDGLLGPAEERAVAVGSDCERGSGSYCLHWKAEPVTPGGNLG